MKKCFVSLLFLILLAACTSHEDFDVVKPESLDITISSGIKSMPRLATRSAIISDINQWPEEDLAVGFFRAPDALESAANWSSPAQIGATFTTGGDIDWGNNKQFYNLDPTLYAHFIGYHPHGTGVPAIADEGGKARATWAIDGKTDVLLSEYIFGNKENKTASKNVDLEAHFQHLLSWMTFEIKQVEEGATNIWGKIESIEILDTPNAVSTLLGDNDYNVTISSTKANLTTLNSDWNGAPTAQALTTTAAFFSQALIAPPTSFDIKVVTENHPNGYTTTVTFPSAEGSGGAVAPGAGTKHLITLSFSSKEITVKGTIAPWEDGSDGEVAPIE